MTTKVDEKVDAIKAMIEIEDIKRMNFRLSDAIREGSKVSDQAYDWGDGENACALSAAVMSAKARGYMQ